MVAIPKEESLSVRDYLLEDAKSEMKLEYYWGDVLAMAGASFYHNIISANVTAGLHSQLRKRPCVTTPSDMRLFAHNQMYTYPDVMVVCGEPEVIRDRGDTLLNPTVIIEVLSPSTEAKDRGIKWQAYREIESLQDYLMIYQAEARVEHYTRTDAGWLLRDAVGLEAQVNLMSIDCVLPLSDIYEKVDFSVPTEEESIVPNDKDEG